MEQGSKEMKLQGRYPEYTVYSRRAGESKGRERGSKDTTQERSASGGREG